MSEILISDKVLLESFRTCYSDMEFSEEFKTRIKDWFTFLDTLQEYCRTDFSLFEYVYLSKQHRNKESTKAEKSNIILPNELWKELLQESIALLKRYDLRENQKQEYSVKIIVFPDIVKISDYYERSVDFEKILYGSDPWYRDHFAHVIRVWLFGLFIIYNQKNQVQSPKFSFYDDTDNTFFSMPELFAAYTIAALTHDLGYPLEKLKKLNKKVSEILDSFGGVNWSQINASFSFDRYQSASILLKLLSSKVSFHNPDLNGEIKDHRLIRIFVDDLIELKKHIKNIAEYHKFNADQGGKYRIYLRSQWKYHEKYFDSLEGYDHGFLSALLLHRKLIFFKEGEFAIEEDYPFSIEEARQFLIRREILRAIATHTCEGIYIIKLLSIESLLFFTDEIQEWGRPFFSDLYGGKIKNLNQKVFLNEYNANNIDWTVDANEISMPQAIYWLISVSRKFNQRFRPAPEEGDRDFCCSWTLKWQCKGIDFIGEFFFDKVNCNILITNGKNGCKLELMDYLNYFNGGRYRTIEDIVDHIISKNTIYKSNIEP